MKRKIKFIVLLFIVNFCYLPIYAQIQKITSSTGKVQIIGYENEIALFVSNYNLENETASNFIDKVIILQSENDYSDEYFEIDDVCNIMFYPEIISISYSENFLLFGFENNTKNLASQLDSKNIQIFEGYGLAQVETKNLQIDKNSLKDNSSNSAYDLILNHLNKKAGSGGNNGNSDESSSCTGCTSGGTGATSCAVHNSWSGCSVTCDDGYHACCKNSYNICKCCPNGDIHND